MDISNRFSLADFFAYLFPGIFTSAGLYLLISLTPLNQKLEGLSINSIGVGTLFLIFSFIVGIINSGFSEIMTNSIRHKNDAVITLDGFEANVKKAFVKTFGGKENFKWTRAHFYLCRSMVTQYMPNEVPEIQRQSGLRQLRMNLLPGIVTWMFTGAYWGWEIHNDFSQAWGISVILFSITLGVFIFLNTLNRMENNNKREARETIAAFLIGCETGLFKRK
ncbi:MAG: hypothetical protein J0M11_13535 [Anaerolineae bacterium]|nr:hypothetical protein [Anaerolineae bacterium]